MNKKTLNLEDHPFFKQAKLMLESLPAITEEKCFALKGGTAINFFVRDMPRLSVDIDLTYLPIEDRPISLNKISAALTRVSERILKIHPGIRTQTSSIKNTGIITKLFVNNQETQIVIEPNLTLRGVVFPTKIRRVSPKVKKNFGASVSTAVASTADLYGGKICAALDRQHPRDLFDVKILFENEGITDDIRKCFVVYLSGSDRPMSELLEPMRKDISSLYKGHFFGMALHSVSLQELLDAREKLISQLMADLTNNERNFLLSIKEGNPKWELLDISGIEKLPAIQWKVLNVKKMGPQQHRKSIDRLKAVLKL